MNQKSFVAASLRLFKSVPEATYGNEKAVDASPVVLTNYSTIIPASSLHYEAEIKAFLKAEGVSGKQMNQTFYSTPDEVEGKTLLQRLTDQYLHYFSTYGLRSLGIHTDFQYIPNDWEKIQLPEPLKYSIITAVPAETLISSCLNPLESGIALKQETIEDLLLVLDGCGYEFSGSEVIRSKEARMFIYDRKSILPTNGEDLFRYLVYKATGKTLLVKDKATLEAIKTSKYALPTLDPTRLTELAKSFNRRKEYWMAFKSANNSNRSVVNKITKLSKSAHQPLKQDLLMNLTNGSQISLVEVAEALKNANVFRVIRAANALRAYRNQVDNRLYVVRNGKSFIKPANQPLTNSLQLNKIAILLDEYILSHIDQTKKVYIPSTIKYSLPTSEKMFTGDVPNFSIVEVDPSDRDLLVGIYWENGGFSHVDYDLSFDSIRGERVGWNSRWGNGELTFSGDVTNAPQGAAEWFVIKNLTAAWKISNNLYSSYGCSSAHGESFPEFTIMVGYGNKGSKTPQNYFIKPDDVLFKARVNPTRRQTTIGTVSPTEDGKIRFTLLNTANGNRAVSTPSGAVEMVSALLSRVESSLRLNDYVNLVTDPAEADIDLSPGNVTKDSILGLFKQSPD